MRRTTLYFYAGMWLQNAILAVAVRAYALASLACFVIAVALYFASKAEN